MNKVDARGNIFSKKEEWFIDKLNATWKLTATQLSVFEELNAAEVTTQTIEQT